MEKEELISKFINLVLLENKKFNLTAVTNIEEFKNRHIEDSLAPSKVFDFSNKEILDLGSGAGFPGIPLAIYNPSSKFYLVEPIEKRASFLKMVKDTLLLDNVEIINKRMEELPKSKKYDLIVSRAVSELSILLELSIPYLKVGGILIAYKGKKGEEELIKAKNALKILNAKVINIQKEKINNNDERNNIFIIKEKECDSIYPRLYQKIKKKPL